MTDSTPPGIIGTRSWCTRSGDKKNRNRPWL